MEDRINVWRAKLETARIRRDIFQGDILSPLLFSTDTHDVERSKGRVLVGRFTGKS